MPLSTPSSSVEPMDDFVIISPIETTPAETSFDDGLAAMTHGDLVAFCIKLNEEKKYVQGEK